MWAHKEGGKEGKWEKAKEKEPPCLTGLGYKLAQLLWKPARMFQNTAGSRHIQQIISVTRKVTRK